MPQTSTTTKSPALCGSRLKKGREGTCTKPAGWGTVHPGSGHCKWHGGSTPGGIEHAAKEEMSVMGAPVENLHPGDALLFCCKIAAGEVQYCTFKIEELTEDEAVGNPESYEEDEYEIEETGASGVHTKRKFAAPDLHIWIKARQTAMDRLARYCKMALDANVDERRVQLAERWGDDLARLLKGILGDLELTAAQKKKAPEIIQRHLLQLEVGSGRLA